MKYTTEMGKFGQARVVYAEDLTQKQELYIALHHRCALCDAELEISHDVDKLPGKIVETAQCPQCKIRTRSVEHTSN